MTDAVIRLNIGRLHAPGDGVLSGTVIWTEPLTDVPNVLPRVIGVTGWTFVRSARSADRSVPLTPADLRWENERLRVQFPPEHRRLETYLLDWQHRHAGHWTIHTHPHLDAHVRLHLEVL